MAKRIRWMAARHQGLAGPRTVWPAAALAILATSARAAPAPPHTSPASPGVSKIERGFEWSLASSTQGNFGPLSIGVGYVGGGDYLDEREVRHSGLHAGLTISVDGKPALYQQPDVHEGQILSVGPYRILIERLLPAAHGRGVVVLRISHSKPARATAPPPAPANAPRPRRRG